MLVEAQETCFIDNGRRVKGERFEYSGPPNPNVFPVNPSNSNAPGRPTGGKKPEEASSEEKENW
jgi:hypothetical protein